MPQWLKIALWISVGVVGFLGISAFIISLVKVKKIKDKYLNDKDALAKKQLIELRGDNWGKLPYELKEFYNSKTNDNDIDSWINTVFLNDYKTLLIASKNLDYELVCLNLLSPAKITINKNIFDESKYTQACEINTELSNKKISVLSQNEIKDSKFDLIYATNIIENNTDIFANYFNLLNNNGMLVIRQDDTNKAKLRELISDLKFAQVTYEVSSVASKFIYIVKNANIS
ncbi:hypothetical protein MBVG596_0313 [Mycoplasmopsis bovigenitalium]|uniref:BC85_0335 family putative methyltransferase n=1 Tax=Mycoplasmopsis bovigenitalium TaxID=2112 RepID=UPI00090B5166|nr:hypothetical protein [Mycoplasmopsis bovigenitalium]BAW18145.1 hypothetical protein MBVG596_0313 [Mycoplasmopsis bovigenitalium]